VAERCHKGNKIERGERKFTGEHIRKLSSHFSLNAEYFLPNEEDEQFTILLLVTFAQG
jgi:hypothetical protein